MDDGMVPKLDIGDVLGSGPIGIPVGIKYRVPTPCLNRGVQNWYMRLLQVEYNVRTRSINILPIYC